MYAGGLIFIFAKAWGNASNPNYVEMVSMHSLRHMIDYIRCSERNILAAPSPHCECALNVVMFGLVHKIP